jgi:hypothetical protein
MLVGSGALTGRDSPVPLVGSSFNPSCSWIAVKIDVPPAGSGGAAPLPPGVVSSGAVLRDSQVLRQ